MSPPDQRAQSLSRSPRGARNSATLESDVQEAAGACDEVNFASMFEAAASALNFRIDRLFVPIAMLPHVKGPFLVFDNCDVASLEKAFRDGRNVWVHGSSSDCIKVLLRERKMQACFVSDVVRSDLGMFADPHNAALAPLGSLSSQMFCRSVRSLSILERMGGWQDCRHRTTATYLYAFQCGPCIAREDHEFQVNCLNLDLVLESDIDLSPTNFACSHRTVVVESAVALATLHRLETERMIRIQRMQRQTDGYRYVIAVASGSFQTIWQKLLELRCAVFDLDMAFDSNAVVYLPNASFHRFLQCAANCGASNVGIMREAPRWVTFRGNAQDVQKLVQTYEQFVNREHPEMSSNVRIAKVSPGTDMQTCNMSVRVVNFRSRPVGDSVRLVTSTAPWVSEDAVQTMLQTLDVQCHDVTIKRGSEGACVILHVDEPNARIVESKHFSMQWQNKRCRFKFERGKQDESQQKRAQGNNVVHPKRDSTDASCALSPLPPVKRFMSMGADDKQNVMKHAIMQRLPSTFDQREIEVTERIVDHFKEREHKLFDVVRSAPVMQQMFDDVASEIGISQAPPRVNIPSEGDLIEIQDAPLKQAWNGCVLRVRNVDSGDAAHSTFVEGELVTPAGEIAQSCAIFQREVQVKRERKNGRDYLSVKHPGAKLIFDGHPGSKWISCNQGVRRARELAEEVKHVWETAFAKRIDQMIKMRICLCTSTPCSHQSDDMVMHVNSWTVLPNGSFGNVFFSSAESNKQRVGAQESERMVKQRTSASNKPGPSCEPPEAQMTPQ